MGVGDVSASGCGGCISTTDRAHSKGSVTAPGTEHTATGVYQHHGQATQQKECSKTRDRAQGGGVSASSLGVYQHHGQATEQGECISTRDRAQGGGASASGLGCISTTDRAHGVGRVAAPWTGHTGLYPQARGN